MTEEEAKTKACCAKLGLGPHKESWMPSGAACIGSACMAWRWDERIHFWGNAQGGACSTVNEQKPPEGFVIHQGSKNSLDGHCGLAGRP